MTKTRVGVCLLALSSLGLFRPAAAAAAAPSTPPHITARGTSPGTVTVTWDASPGATEYRVYADVDPVRTLVTLIPPTFGIASNGQLVATVTGTSAIESSLPALVRRFYAVVAVNSDGASQPAFADWVVIPAQPEAAIFGMADLHTHQFSNLAFGRGLVWG